MLGAEHPVNALDRMQVVQMRRHPVMLGIENGHQRMGVALEVRDEQPMIAHALAQPLEDQIDGRRAQLGLLHRGRRR